MRKKRTEKEKIVSEYMKETLEGDGSSFGAYMYITSATTQNVLYFDAEADKFIIQDSDGKTLKRYSCFENAEAWMLENN